jgi:hypothetical protein
LPFSVSFTKKFSGKASQKADLTLPEMIGNQYSSISSQDVIKTKFVPEIK